MKFSNLPLNLRGREQRSTHLRSLALLCCPFLNIFKKAKATLTWKLTVLLQVFMCCCQSACARFFQKLNFCLLTSGLFCIKFRIISHFLAETIVMSSALCFCQHCFIMLMQSLSKALWFYLAVWYTQGLKGDERFQVAWWWDNFSLIHSWRMVVSPQHVNTVSVSTQHQWGQWYSLVELHRQAPTVYE